MNNIILSTAGKAGLFAGYAQFEAWANAQSVTYATGGNDAISPGSFRLTNNSQGVGTMDGSPHGTRFRLYGFSTYASRLMQHAYPSQAAYTAGLNQKCLALVTGDNANQAAFNVVARNGYTSQYWNDSYGMQAGFLDDFIYWDPLLNKAMRRSPRQGDSGAGIPVEFNGVL